MRLLISTIGWLSACFLSLNAQDYAAFVDPFIGTDKSDIKTVWGHYGGTYPGAVAPWGSVQLSPETSRTSERGYLYRDTSICYFTCVNHSSGYPEGSHGNIRITFASEDKHTDIFNLEQEFSHANESAGPGYYGVKFNDGSKVDMTATTHAGMFRYYPVREMFIVAITDAGKVEVLNDSTIGVNRHNGVFIFNQPWKKYRLEEGRIVLEFDHLPESAGLLIKTGFSLIDKKGSFRNLETEMPDWDFEKIRKQTYRDWNNELNVVGIESESVTDCKKFYTALYHSFLVPYIVSDVDGRYRGADRQIHRTDGLHEYGKFSTWDTFRSLHPLLCLLKPQRQLDMLKSMLHIYDQEGNLPYQPMIGYHSLPIIADSYMKGITALDTDKAYDAMKKCLSGNQIPKSDTYHYIAKGFLNDSIDESVSITLDYAYNDWTLAIFAEATGYPDDAAMFRNRSFNYRNLYDTETQFMLPRNQDGFVLNPGEMGYKEADKWTASWFVPHNIQDLINLSGGDRLFTEHLQQAMELGHIVHDNEPVLNYPYLFSYAGRPDLTCLWIDQIRKTCYTSSPGGVPGNDDLGSMSSWFVFSAMGFYPVCPGRPEYVLTTPLFSSVKMYRDNDKIMHITADKELNQGHFSNLKLNGQDYNKLFISHEQLISGGTLHFGSGNRTDFSDFGRPGSLTTSLPVFQIKDIRLSNKKIVPHQEAFVYFSVKNTGATGTFPAILMNKGQAIATRLVLVEQGATVTDSLPFRLYPEGKQVLIISDQALQIQVDPSENNINKLNCNRLYVTPLVKEGEKSEVDFELQNISGKPVSGKIPLYVDDSIASSISYQLEPGEKRCFKTTLRLPHTGFYTVRLIDKNHTVKIYGSPRESCVLDIDFNDHDGETVRDNSGFGNHGMINGAVEWMVTENGKAIQIGTDAYISFPLSESLQITGKTISLSAWVYPMLKNDGYIDFFTKGDYNVLKTSGSDLSFFAGGWGRGDCTIPLPSDWLNNWHHLAGVCDGKTLKIYLNGVLQQTQPIEGDIERTEIPWNLGRNAEMPYSRRYKGMFDNIKIYQDALSDSDIENLYKQQ